MLFTEIYNGFAVIGSFSFFLPTLHSLLDHNSYYHHIKVIIAKTKKKKAQQKDRPEPRTPIPSLRIRRTHNVAFVKRFEQSCESRFVRFETRREKAIRDFLMVYANRRRMETVTFKMTICGRRTIGPLIWVWKEGRGAETCGLAPWARFGDIEGFGCGRTARAATGRGCDE